MTRRWKILLVDDSDLALELAKMKLEEAGYAVVTLNSPFGFSATFRAERPDLVLLDVSMPALQGDRLVQIARRHWSSHPPSRAGVLGTPPKRCPIVLYSDRPARELRSIALNCGADAYVAKNADFANVITI